MSPSAKAPVDPSPTTSVDSPILEHASFLPLKLQVSMHAVDPSLEPRATPSVAPNHADVSGERLDARVVFLVNFLAPNHVAVCEALTERIREFTILCSVEMEGNRQWKPCWNDLDVRVQKTWTLTRKVEHPGGYQEPNYIHIPTDTFSQLRQLKPDAIVSLELGARTAIASAYQRLAKRCAMVTSVYASERSEAGRGVLRNVTRKRLLRRADWVTYNGPSCRNYVCSMGANPERMSAWDYAADPTKPYRGEIDAAADSLRNNALNLLTVGQLSQRKGIIGASELLSRWAAKHPGTRVTWHLHGQGPMQDKLQTAEMPSNLTLRFHGHSDPEQLRSAYRDCDALFFPTLTDEWGLVVDEALHSGLPVIGSVHSQAVTTLIHNGINGFQFDPDHPASLFDAMNQLMQLSNRSYRNMQSEARQSVSDRTPTKSADQLIRAIRSSMAFRFGKSSGSAAPNQSPCQGRST